MQNGAQALLLPHSPPAQQQHLLHLTMTSPDLPQHWTTVTLMLTAFTPSASIKQQQPDQQACGLQEAPPCQQLLQAQQHRMQEQTCWMAHMMQA